jgi:two-component system OmpR family sensor kinase
VTLRARLLLALGGLLLAALVVSGALVVGLTRSALIEQLDSDLRTPTSADLTGFEGSPPADPAGRRFAVLMYSDDGALIETFPSGGPNAPDPLPQLPPGGVGALPLGTVVELPGAHPPVSYRVLARRLEVRRQPVRVVLAAPMRDVNTSTSLLVRSLVIVGLVVLAVALTAGWLLIRRGLRPLEGITATAEQIAAGDLSRRVNAPDDGSEVGRLGNAFDAMLDKIQGAFDSQHAALVAKERSESQLRQFVADASHELRTPLTAVRGYAELYRAGGLADPEALDQAMARIGSESRRMSSLVEDLLLLARLDQGRRLRRDPVRLSDVVHDALADLRALEPGRPVTAAVQPEVTISGDEDRLRQVIGNLLANVRIHTPPDAAVEVSLTAADGRATLTVADHGPGVDPVHVEHIFDRFYRADTGRSRDRGGAGLGLAIAASVARAHGGEIRHAPTPGGGATFTLTLPWTVRP